MQLRIANACGLASRDHGHAGRTVERASAGMKTRSRLSPPAIPQTCTIWYMYIVINLPSRPPVAHSSGNTASRVSCTGPSLSQLGPAAGAGSGGRQWGAAAAPAPCSHPRSALREAGAVWAVRITRPACSMASRWRLRYCSMVGRQGVCMKPSSRSRGMCRVQ